MITASVMSVANQGLCVLQRIYIPLAVKNYYKKYKKEHMRFITGLFFFLAFCELQYFSSHSSSTLAFLLIVTFVAIAFMANEIDILKRR